MVRRFLNQLRGFWDDGLPPNSLQAYLFAVGCFLVTIPLRVAFGAITGGVGLFTVYFPAVLVASRVGGIGAGSVALILGGMAGWAGFVWPSKTPLPLLAQGVLELTYLVSGGLIVWIADSQRRSARRLRTEEARRVLLLRELQHRSANIITLVQAIVSQSLRSNEADVQKLNARIGALAATNDLLTKSVEHTVDLRDLLRKEIKPYGEGRIAMEGKGLALSPELARTLALVFHELMANAAKYGALSRPNGRLHIRWKTADGHVQIGWVESGGPPVTPPRERGFGTTLLEHILDGHEGKVEIDFRPGGIVCSISFALTRGQLPPLILDAPLTRTT